MKIRKLCAAILAAGLALSMCVPSFAGEEELLLDSPGTAEKTDQPSVSPEELPGTPPAEEEGPTEDTEPSETPEEEEPSSENKTPSESVLPEDETPAEPVPPEDETPSEPVPPEDETPSEPVPPEDETPSEPLPPENETPSEPTVPPEDETPSEPVPPEDETPSEPTVPPEDEAPADPLPPEDEVPPEDEILPEEEEPSEPPIIEVAIPSSGQVIINPYRLKVEKDGRKVTDQVVSSTLYLQNRSEVAVSVNAVSMGRIPAGSGITFVTDPPERRAEEKELFLYAEFLPSSDDASEPEWSGEYSGATNQLMVTSESLSKEGVMILEPAGQPDSYGAMRLFGSTVVEPEEEWDTEDRIETTFAYTFDAVMD